MAFNSSEFLQKLGRMLYTDLSEITLFKILIRSCQPSTRFQAPWLKVESYWTIFWTPVNLTFYLGANYSFINFPSFLRICLAPLMTYLQEQKQPWVQQLVHQVLQAAKESRATQHSHLFLLMPLHISPASLGAHPLPLWALLLEATSQDLVLFLLQVFQVNSGMLLHFKKFELLSCDLFLFLNLGFNTFICVSSVANFTLSVVHKKSFRDRIEHLLSYATHVGIWILQAWFLVDGCGANKA